MTGEPGPHDRPEAASPREVERLAGQFREAGRPFARVTVVRREPPVSATVGDRALVTPDGEIVGWIGGAACAQSVVVREATAALEDGEPRLLGLAPDPETVDRPGVESFPMTCHSGGVLELFVDPVAPTPRLVVVGDTTAARTLVRLAAELEYEVTAVSVSDEPPAGLPDGVTARAESGPAALTDAVEGASFLVIATMGGDDDVAIEAGLRADVPYVGLVASETRAEELYGTVAERLDRSPEEVAAAVTSPAGIDVGAGTPGEIAASLLAELVDVGPVAGGAAPSGEGEAATASGASEAAPSDAGGADEAAEADDAAGADDGTAVDPVCGMDVAVGEAAATVEVEGATYHFCGQGCADAFEADPGRYLDEGAN